MWYEKNHAIIYFCLKSIALFFYENRRTKQLFYDTQRCRHVSPFLLVHVRMKNLRACAVSRARSLRSFFFQWATKPQSTVCTRVIGPVWRSSRVVLLVVHYLNSLPREGQWRAPQRRLHSICIRQIKGAVNATIQRQGGANEKIGKPIFQQ